MKYLTVLIMCSCLFAQSPNLKFVDSFSIQGIPGIPGNVWPVGSNSLHDWILNEDGTPVSCSFRTSVTPLDSSGIPLSFGGICFSVTKVAFQDNAGKDLAGAYILPLDSIKIKTGKDGIGFYNMSLVMSAFNNVECWAQYDVTLSGKYSTASSTPLFWWSRPRLFWEQYSVWWACYCDNYTPEQMSKQDDSTVVAESMQGTSEIWRIHGNENDSTITSLVALPSVDVNNFERYATPNYVTFEVLNSGVPSTIIRYIHGISSLGLDICTMVRASVVSVSNAVATYKTEFLVPVEKESDQRLYADPNGIKYHFIYTSTVFSLTDVCDDDNNQMIYELLQNWLGGGYTKLDIDNNGIIDFKDLALLQ